MCRDFLVTVKGNAKGKLDHAKFKVMAVTMGLMASCPTLAFASDSSGEVAGKNLLVGPVFDAVQSSFMDTAATATGIIAIAVVAGCSVIGISAGAKYAMKKIKGTLNQAA